MRNVLLAVVLFSSSLVGAEEHQLKERHAARLFLSDGDVVDVVDNEEFSTVRSMSTIYLRDTGGTTLTITCKQDKVWNTSEVTIKSGETRMKIHLDLGFVKDNLPSPLAVQIGEQIYRTMWGDVGKTPEAMRKLQSAVSKMPANFTSALKTAFVVANTMAVPELPGELYMFNEFFEERVPQLTLQGKAALKPEEIDKLMQMGTN